MLIDVRGLAIQRGEKILFKSLNFSLHENELILITGENGAGKSSLLKSLVGLLSASHGKITHQQSVKKSCHFIHHENGLKLGLTVLENLKLFSLLHNQPLQHTADILKNLKLEKTQHVVCKNLSAGQKRRVTLAKLFLFPKKIWILDEPLTSLDSDTQHFFVTALQKHLSAKGAAIVSSHQPLPLNQTEIKTIRIAAC